MRQHRSSYTTARPRTAESPIAAPRRALAATEARRRNEARRHCDRREMRRDMPAAFIGSAVSQVMDAARRMKRTARGIGVAVRGRAERRDSLPPGQPPAARLGGRQVRHHDSPARLLHGAGGRPAQARHAVRDVCRAHPESEVLRPAEAAGRRTQGAARKGGGVPTRAAGGACRAPAPLGLPGYASAKPAPERRACGMGRRAANCRARSPPQRPERATARTRSRQKSPCGVQAQPG